MAGVVGVGTGADSARSEADGGPSLYRGGSPCDALESYVLPSRRRGGSVGDHYATPWHRWEVIVEPDTDAEALVVVTAYSAEED